MTNKIFFGEVPGELDEESGEELDADGLGCVRGSIFSVFILVLFVLCLIPFIP